MNRFMSTFAVVVVLLSAAAARVAAAAVPGRAQSPKPAGSILALRVEIKSLQMRIDTLMIKLKSQERELQDAKTRAQSGLMPTSELFPLEQRVADCHSELISSQLALAELERLAALANPVDLKLKSWGLHEAAEVLSRVSSVGISVAPGVPKDIRLTTEAKGLPLGAVLEVIADSARLTIAPGESGGIVLKPVSSMRITGEKTPVSIEAVNWPWSWEWGGSACEGTPAPLGRRWLRIVDSAWPLASSSSPGGTNQEGAGK